MEGVKYIPSNGSQSWVHMYGQLDWSLGFSGIGDLQGHYEELGLIIRRVFSIVGREFSGSVTISIMSSAKRLFYVVCFGSLLL